VTAAPDGDSITDTVHSLAAPVVSIGMPTYRGAAHLRQAIESVLGQTFASFELIVVDDDSPDETASIAASYNDPRIRLVRNPARLGPEANWNRCLALATGRYFKLLPQDDLLAPTCLEMQVTVLNEDIAERYALVFCARRVVDSRGRPLMVRRYGGGTRAVPAGQLVRQCVRKGTNLVGEPGGVLFRRAASASVGAFDASLPYVIDLDYWIRLLKMGDAYYLERPLVSFRVSPGSWSVAIGAEQSREFRSFIERIKRTLDFNISRIDVAAGSIMARVNNRLRMLLYRLVLR
jgi:glycosyltransferase involved in cell wall biosynthesis